MRNTWLIVKREYLARVRTRSFVVLTLLLPGIAAAAFIVPLKIATMKSGRRTPHLVVVTSVHQLGELVRSQLLAKDQSNQDDDDDSAAGASQENTRNCAVHWL